MREKGYSYPLKKTKIALAKIIQLVWQFYYITFFVELQVFLKKRKEIYLHATGFMIY